MNRRLMIFEPIVPKSLEGLVLPTVLDYREVTDMEEPSIEYDAGFIDGVEEGKRQGQERIKELEDTFKDVCDLINREGMVSKWRILNRLERTLKS